MATAEVSVVIPACAAERVLWRAVESALASRGVQVEVVVAANDEADYAALLNLSLQDARRVAFVRTPAPRSGPSSARNLGASVAQAPLLAFLDADDFYAPDRLARLAPLAREHGAATGPCVFIEESDAERGYETALRGAVSQAADGEVAPLTIETIIGARRSFSPVARRELIGPWRDVRFAEDMIFNAELRERAPAYRYDPLAVYGYVQTAGSATRGPGSLERALGGYGDILGRLFEFELAEPVRRLLFQQMLLDLRDFGAARFMDQGAETSHGWQEAVREADRRRAADDGGDRS